MKHDCDFCGWATKIGLTCADGRMIMKDAFKHNDGLTVPLVWNHQHDEPENVLGHALLENRDEGVYAYCSFNDTEQADIAKVLVKHGDIKSLSIYANQLKQQGSNVIHGSIREVSLVLAGANPGASIEQVIVHSDTGEFIREMEDEAIIHVGEDNGDVLYHADEKKVEKEDAKVADETKKTPEESGEETIAEVFDTLSEKQKNAVYAVIGMALEEDDSEDEEEESKDDEEEKVEHSEGGDNSMKHNVFDQTEEAVQGGVLTHSDQQAIIALAKSSGVGSFQEALRQYTEQNALAHGIDQEDIGTLFPDPKLITPGAPEVLRDDQSWVMRVINKIHKSPYSRIRTRQADARIAELKAKGYQKKGDQKRLNGDIKLLGRTFDPQTIYMREDIHRDDIIDIQDFDYVSYVKGLMTDNMYETLALAALVGDGREDGDPDKIHENHIKPIWTDDELYTIHAEIDIEAVKTELQGSNTGANFGESFIYAEAIITKALYAREQYKGSGRPDLLCAPHLVNVMLLARDLNGRRIYDSKADLAKALNVGEIYEIEQLDGKIRTTDEGDKKKLLGLFVNLSDYQFGSAKGGELTRFEDFDIDFNKYKYLLETRLSGALVKPYAAIALEEPVEDTAG